MPTVDELEKRIMESRNRVVAIDAAQTVIKALRSRERELESQIFELKSQRLTSQARGSKVRVVN